MKILFTTLFIGFSISFSSAQTISGFVKDKKTGESIIGAAIRMEDSPLATSTNTYGFFSLTAKELKSTLKVSSVGYKTETVKINDGSKTLLIELEEEVGLLDEVQVIGRKEPQSLEQGLFLNNLSQSLESSKNKIIFKLPPGCSIFSNNYFMLHGRQPFIENKELKRELMRQRGVFYN